MTAPVVYALLRSEAMTPEALEDSATMPQAAEHSRRDIPGQLWERLAEQSYAVRRDNIVRPEMQGIQPGCTCTQCEPEEKETE